MLNNSVVSNMSISCISCIGKQILSHWATWAAQSMTESVHKKIKVFGQVRIKGMKYFEVRCLESQSEAMQRSMTFLENEIGDVTFNF